MVVKNWKCTEWSQNQLEHLTVKITLHKIPLMPNFCSFRSTTSRLRDTRLSKVGKIRHAPNDVKMTLNTWQSTVPCIHEVTTNEAYISSFSLYDQPFSRYNVPENRKFWKFPNDLKLTLKSWQSKVPHINLPPRPKCLSVLLHDHPFSRYKVVKNRKKEVHQMTSKWPWTLKSQKYFAYNKYLPLRLKFSPVSLNRQRFAIYRTFYNSPLIPMLNGQKKNKQLAKNPKF